MKLIRELFQSMSFALCLFFAFLTGFAAGTDNWLGAVIFALFALVCLGLMLIHRNENPL